MDRYTRYYVNQSGGGGGEIDPVYRPSFRVQTGNGIGSLFRGFFHLLKPMLYSGAKAVGKEALKIGSYIITDIRNKEPEQPVGNIFKNSFSEAKGYLEEKIKNMAGSGLGLKTKRKFKKAQSESERRNVKDIFTEKKITRKMECLISGLDIFLKRSIQTSVVNSYTVIYKPIAPAENPAQLEFNCSGIAITTLT